MNNENTRDTNKNSDKQAQELLALLNQMERRPAAKKPAAKPKAPAPVEKSAPAPQPKPVEVPQPVVPVEKPAPAPQPKPVETPQPVVPVEKPAPAPQPKPVEAPQPVVPVEKPAPVPQPKPVQPPQPVAPPQQVISATVTKPAALQPTKSAAQKSHSLNLPDTVMILDDGEEPVPMQQLQAGQLSGLLIAPDEVVEEEEQTTAEEVAQLLQAQTEEKAEETDELPPPPADRRNPIGVMFGLLWAGLPHRGDGCLMSLFKTGGFMGSLAVILALCVLLVEFTVFPYQNRWSYNRLEKMYYSDAVDHQIIADPSYPAGTLTAFRQLYGVNDQVRGWLSFHSTGTDFLDIEYPVVQSDGNTSYKTHDFYKNSNRNGCLYFDQSTRIQRSNGSKVLIVHGNNVVNGQMLSNLNKLMGNVNNARGAAQFTLSTLYEESEYLVFAVILMDADSSEFTLRTEFEDADDFLGYSTQLRARSLFNYPAEYTSIYSTDKLAMLTVPVSASGSHIDNGRLVVVGRRRRPNELTMDTSRITKNADVIMPYQWYIKQNLNPHQEYYVSTVDTTTTTAVVSPETDEGKK